MARMSAGTSPRLVRLVAAGLVGMLAIGSGCAGHLGTTATSFLKHVREDRDPNTRHRAYAKLANPNCFDSEPQKVEAVEVLGSALVEKTEPPITRAVICRTLGEIGRPEAREPLLHALDDPEPVIRAAACRALGHVGTADDAVTLARLMVADQDPDCRIAAIEGMRALRSDDPRIGVVLADAMENPDPAIRLVAYEALQVTTGRDLGPDPKPWKALAQSRAPQSETPDLPDAATAAAPEMQAGYSTRR